MKRADIQQPPCTCPECVQAGVDDKPQLRDPHSGKLLHGYELRRNYEAADRFLDGFRKLVGAKGMPA